MDNIEAKEVAEVFAKSLDDTQRNAIDTENLVKQVCDMSNQDTHRQVIDHIIADENTDWEKKVDLIQKANTEFDQREANNTQRVMNLQSTQTQNAGAATSWWAEHWGWVLGIGLLLIGVGTPGGRKTITHATKYLLTAQ